MKYISVTHCTANKSFPAQIVLSGPKQDQNSVFNLWNEKIEFCNTSSPAQDLYSSRGYKSLLQSIDVNSEFYVVSAGLGLVRRNTLVPSYDCTIAPGHPSSLCHMCREKPNLKKWWEKLRKTRFSAAGLATICSEADALLISLTKNYIDMVLDDLREVSKPTIIFTTERNFPNQLPQNFLRAPYSEAFDGPMGKLRGTKADLAQRCHADFLNRLRLCDNDYERVLSDVKENMLSWPTPEKGTPKTSKTDQEIISIIEDHFLFFTNKRNFLRHLRHNLNIPCEEKRFSKLYMTVKRQRLCRQNY